GRASCSAAGQVWKWVSWSRMTATMSWPPGATCSADAVARTVTGSGWAAAGAASPRIAAAARMRARSAVGRVESVMGKDNARGGAAVPADVRQSATDPAGVGLLRQDGRGSFRQGLDLSSVARSVLHTHGVLHTRWSEAPTAPSRDERLWLSVERLTEGRSPPVVGGTG